MTALSSAALLARMEALHPRVIDLSLGRIEALLARLGNPEAAMPPVIHVAGTNGKGSTLAMVRAGLEAEGAICHAYTSPHLVSFHERIRVAGDLVSEAALASTLQRVLDANDTAPITFFEITTAAAFALFAEVRADWSLIEVGLGGRLDATNVVTRPRLCVITPVSRDHEDWLGDTLGAIAFEKAGILKPGVPCIVGPQMPEARAVIEARAAEVGAPLLLHGQDWEVRVERGRLVYRDLSGLCDLPLPALHGPHQVENAGAALAVLRHLGGGEAAYEAAVACRGWPGRLQRLGPGTGLAAAIPGGEVWVDGGHNPAAGAALAAALDAMPPRQVWLVCGMLSTKETTGFLAPLARVSSGIVAVPVPGSSAGRPPEEVARTAAALGLTAETAPDARTAIEHIAAVAPSARILVCGSLYLAGAVLADVQEP